MGPITLPSSPLEAEPAYCIAFKNRLKTLVAKGLQIGNEILALRKQLQNRNLDPITRKAIEQRLIDLHRQLTDVSQQIDILKES